jgi:cysteine desulfurase
MGTVSKGKVYFDCNATTSVLPAAVKASLQVMQDLYGNPSSSHSQGIQAKAILESARGLVNNFLSAGDPNQIIFTSGATEAIQLAVFSALLHLRDQAKTIEPSLILYGATEHKAVPEALHYWTDALKLSAKIEILPVDKQGLYDLEFLKKQAPHLSFICTMAVNNETGVVQNLDEVEKVLNDLNSKALWLVDGVQALGKTEINLSRSRINYFTASGHKLYALKGTGFLYVKNGSPFKPMIVGGGQERGLRSGTENLPGVASIGAVLKEFIALRDGTPSAFSSSEKLKKYRDQIISTLKAAFPKTVFNTPFDVAVPTTINFSIPGLSSAELMDLFDSSGLRVSAGSACSSTSVKPSHVLSSMGIEPWRCESALRLSFGAATSDAEIAKGCRLLYDCAAALKHSCLLETVVTTEAPNDLRDGMIQFRAGANNTWLYTEKDSKNSIIVDPCDTSADRIENYIRCQKLNVIAVLDTHSHADHDSIRPALQNALKGKTWGDALGWPDANDEALFEITLHDGSKAPAIKLESKNGTETVLARVNTPGHTSDSTALLLGTARNGKLNASDVKFAFCGDTILSGGLGRTNFMVSDSIQLFNSLHQIRKLIAPVKTLLCPSHDYQNSFSTTLAIETIDNPLLSRVFDPIVPCSVSEFVEAKVDLDAKLSNLEADFKGVVCGVTPQTGLKPCESFSLTCEQIKKEIAQKKDFTVIDVREPHEFSFDVDWTSLSLPVVPKNVPLSRFVTFMSDIIIAGDLHKDFIFVCRTGTRSLHVVKTLRRMGFDHAWNLSGGLALL